ncbi:MAG TPA: CpsB/CapC family capsule biosynthesis tyrosine phosphatase [Myxococcota bacterium]|nr:CpsB/CapC family capsule biosynthesis tyrosine phosphatase [Myxococcota bacterium]
MIDIHCHILPGLDDGPADLIGSLRMAAELARLGFRQVFATPHVPWGSAQVDMKAFVERGLALIEKMSSEGCPLKLRLAAEHYSDVVPQLIHESGPLCFPRGDTFLMEFPLSGLPARFEDLLFLAEVKNKKPVIAHVERYPEVQADPAAVNVLRQRGCYLLVNLSGLAGEWSKQARKTAVALVEKGLVDAATTDLHSADRSQAIAEGLHVLEDLVGREGADRMLRTTPAEIAGLVQPLEQH